MRADDVLKLDHQLCFALYAASRAMVQAYQPELDRLGITYPQYLALMVLWEQDGQSVKSIGDRLHLDSGTLTPLLKRLEAQGLVQRARSTDDERVVHVGLTARGRRLRQKAVSIPKAMACHLDMAPTELARLRDEVRTLLARLKPPVESAKAV